MTSKTFLNPIRRPLGLILCWLCGLLLFSCMPKANVPVYEKQIPPPPVKRSAPPPAARPDSAQVQAAEALVAQARQLLAQESPDAAIRVLERSVALDSNSGPNYYYLAEAWLMKKNAYQAREFNRLAAMHLHRDSAWQSRIARQSDRIDALGHQ
ncbi:MAG: hypothetical protein WAK95_03125 [Desulfobacterales bacterium]